MPQITLLPIGGKFGRLTVLKEFKNVKGQYRVSCQCECGNIKEHDKSTVKLGKASSCGCLANELTSARSKHGFNRAGKRSKIYGVWASMLWRCENKNCKQYQDYGGRGITVCERWHSFENFLADMQEPATGMMLERKDNNGNYCQDNCVWTDRKTQSRNRRNNRMIEFQGKIQCLAAWAEESGISYGALRHRLEIGWSIEDAITRPLIISPSRK